MTSHGIMCASIVGGCSRVANFICVYEGKIGEFVPFSDLNLYAICCDGCAKFSTFVCETIDEAIRNEIRIIFISLGEKTLHNHMDFTDDPIALKTLEAFKSNIFICLASGNSSTGETTVKNVI